MKLAFLFFALSHPRNAFAFVSSRQHQRIQRISSLNDANNADYTTEYLVLGSGPAARAMASLLGTQSNVILADAHADRDWAPNYGVWKDEWQSIVAKYSNNNLQFKGGNCGNAIDREWQETDCYFGGSYDIPTEQRLRLERPYLRVDRRALQQSLTNHNNYKILKANHISKATSVNVYAPAGSCVHDETGTTMQLRAKNGTVMSVRANLVFDCTGHESSLVLKETREPWRSPGFQIAYGVTVDVQEQSNNANQIGPYDKEAMTLFDYRTDHYPGEQEEKLIRAPTFMYAMPLKGNKIFFEETSLVARPAVSFQECKDRCLQRLEYLGINVTNIEEEEFCYIPMGGALPMKDQRIVGFGGAAAMVHPSTGYHLCRALMGACAVAEAIQTNAGNPDKVAASAYHAIWSPSNIRQRNFAVFGGEFLMKQNVVGLRGFFDGFFALPMASWAGFLAGWPGLPNNDKHETWLARMWFGVTFLTKLPLPVALDMFASIITYSIAEYPSVALLQAVTPFFGEPSSYEYKRNDDRVGDVAAKEEARRMINASPVEEIVPVAFEAPVQDGGTIEDAPQKRVPEVKDLVEASVAKSTL